MVRMCATMCTKCAKCVSRKPLEHGQKSISWLHPQFHMVQRMLPCTKEYIGKLDRFDVLSFCTSWVVLRLNVLALVTNALMIFLFLKRNLTLGTIKIYCKKN